MLKPVSADDWYQLAEDSEELHAKALAIQKAEKSKLTNRLEFGYFLILGALVLFYIMNPSSGVQFLIAVLLVALCMIAHRTISESELLIKELSYIPRPPLGSGQKIDTQLREVYNILSNHFGQRSLSWLLWGLTGLGGLLMMGNAQAAGIGLLILLAIVTLPFGLWIESKFDLF